MDEKLREEGMKLVIDSLEAYRIVIPVTKKVGALDTLWTGGLRDVWGLEAKPVYWYWLAPENDSSSQQGSEISERDRISREGLMIDVGREVDVDIVSCTPFSH